MRTMSNSEWNEIESKLTAITKNSAGRFAKFGGVQYKFDDAIQEGRMALLLAMSSYDEKKGALHSFAATVLANKYKLIMRRLNGKTKNGYTISIDSMPSGQDTFKNNAALQGDMVDSLFEHDLVNCDLEKELLEKELEILMVEFKTELRSNLTDFSAKVFDCRVCPLMKSMVSKNDVPTNVEIARFLGVTKNCLDYALCTIRSAVTSLARKSKYNDLFGDRVTSNQWPQISHSPKAYDDDLVSEAVERWTLSTELVKVSEEHSGVAWRCLEEYKWGTIVYWGDEDTEHTVVAVGRFNSMNGELFGKAGTRETIPFIQKYCDVVKQLKGKKNA